MFAYVASSTSASNYRHVVWSLVRKPGAFARCRYREELFPSLVFRRAYDALRDARAERADVDYLRILHLAASTISRPQGCALHGPLRCTSRVQVLSVRVLDPVLPMPRDAGGVRGPALAPLCSDPAHARTQACQHSIRVNDQYRLCFVWTDLGPTEVECVDYH